MPRVAFQGVPGCYSYLAARKHFPGYRAEGMRDFSSAAAAVLSGKVECALIPIENTVVGEITAAREVLARTPELNITSEIQFRVDHCLMALPGADLTSIRWVESHPVALAQCSHWLDANQLSTRAVEDTAGAAKAIATDRDYRRAAVASAEAAELYGLSIVARSIANVTDNVTRFAVVTRRPKSAEAA